MKTKLLTCLLMIGILTTQSNALIAQFIPDVNFANAIRNRCSICIDAGNNLTPIAKSITNLAVRNQSISDLTGIEGFTGLKDFDCSDNLLTSLPALPNLLTLDCSNNKLKSLTLTTLPKNLTNLNCRNNELTTFPPLDGFIYLKNLYLDGNQLTSLPTLPIVLEYFGCSFNHLTNLPTLPKNLKVLECSNNLLTSLPELTPLLELLGCSNNQLKALPTLPLSNLKNLICSNNQLTSLPTLRLPLELLFCQGNQLTNLPSLPNSVVRIYCYDNQITCLPTLTNTLKVLAIDQEKITCLPNNIADLIVYNALLNPITLPVCGLEINKLGELGACYQSVAAAETAAKGLVKASNKCGNAPKLSATTNTTTCPMTVTVTAAADGKTKSVDFKLNDVAAKGGAIVWKTNMTATSRTICTGQTITMVLNKHLGRVVTWQKTDAYSPVWGDIPYTQNATEYSVVGPVSRTTYYRALICASCGQCAPPYYTAYSSVFKVTPAAICPTNDPTTTIAKGELIVSTVYPTPAHDEVSLQIKGAIQGIARFDILDITNKVVKSENKPLTEGYNEITFDIQNLSSGLHFIKLKDNSNRVAIVKLVKI